MFSVQKIYNTDKGPTYGLQDKFRRVSSVSSSSTTSSTNREDITASTYDAVKLKQVGKGVELAPRALKIFSAKASGYNVDWQLKKYWTHNSDYLWTAIIGLLAPSDVYYMAYISLTLGHGWNVTFTYMFSRAVFGIIVVYLEIFLGVYSKSSLYKLGEMLPIAQDFPFLLTVLNAIHFTIHFNMCTSFILYGIYILSYEMTECPPDYAHNCVNMTAGSDNPLSTKCELQHDGYLKCPNETFYILPTVLFIANNQKMEHFALNRILLVISLCLIMSYFVFRGIQSLTKVVKFSYLTYLGMNVLMILYNFGKPGATTGLLHMFQFNLNFSKWQSSSWKGVYLAFCLGMPVLSTTMFNARSHTSRLKYCTTPSNDCGIILIADFAASVTGIAVIHMMSGVVAHQLNTNMRALTFEGHILLASIVPLFVKGLLPTDGIVAFLWYFASCLFWVMNKLMAVEALYHNLIVSNDFFYIRRIYVLYGYLFCTCLSTTVAVKSPFQMSSVIWDLTIWIYGAMNGTALLLFSLIIMIYGIERLQNDIFFMTETPSSDITSVICKMLPFIAIMMLLFTIWLPGKTLSQATYYLIILIALLDILFHAYRYTDKFGDLVKPIFTYGPPNTKLRRARKLFNMEEALARATLAKRGDDLKDQQKHKTIAQYFRFPSFN